MVRKAALFILLAGTCLLARVQIAHAAPYQYQAPYYTYQILPSFIGVTTPLPLGLTEQGDVLTAMSHGTSSNVYFHGADGTTIDLVSAFTTYKAANVGTLGASSTAFFDMMSDNGIVAARVRDGGSKEGFLTWTRSGGFTFSGYLDDVLGDYQGMTFTDVNSLGQIVAHSGIPFVPGSRGNVFWSASTGFVDIGDRRAIQLTNSGGLLANTTLASGTSTVTGRALTWDGNSFELDATQPTTTTGTTRYNMTDSGIALSAGNGATRCGLIGLDCVKYEYVGSAQQAVAGFFGGPTDDLFIPSTSLGGRADMINEDGGFVVTDGVTGGLASVNWRAEDINDQIVDWNISGYTITRTTSINEGWQIVAQGVNGANQTRLFLLTPVPEPGSLTLLGLGALALRRRLS